MKRINSQITGLLILMSLFFNACGVSQSEGSHQLTDARTFEKKISETPDGVILDVRTPVEFAGGHIANAVNADWNDASFDSKVANLDKSKTYFVYCLAGGRSAAAVAHMQEMGFEHIVELQGGMMQWRAQKLPETTVNTASAPADQGMSVEAFKELLKDERFILVDFYAEWCGPCKKMKPSLDEIAAENSATVKVIRIDVDKNRELAEAMKIEALPTLQIIKNNQMVWSKVGFAEKTELLEHLK